VPDWVEAELGEVIARFRNQAITDELLRRLREELARLGFSQLYPTTVASLVQKK
jgi:6,7-dimethyl-8-ribityllumazine synthase